MGKLSRKAYVSVVVFVLIFVALGATTFAWFTLAELSQLSSISLTAGGGSELSISLEEDGEYSDKISGEDIKDKIGKVRLDSLTSVDGKNLFNMSNKDFSLTKVNYKEIGVNQFIQLTFYFKAIPENLDGNPEIGVYLHNHNTVAKFSEIEQKGTFVVSKGINFTTDTNYNGIDLKEDGTSLIKAGEKVMHYAADAVMVSFEDNSNGKLLLYDFNSKEGHNYNDGYSDDVNELKGAASYYFSKTKKNPGKGDERTTPLGAWAKFEDERNPDIVTETLNSKLCTLTESDTEKGTYYGSVTVRIWVEGFDADCTNALLSDEVMAQFNFRLGYKKNDNK